MAVTTEAMPNFSTTTMENARKAKVSMEQFYENLLIQVGGQNRVGKYYCRCGKNYWLIILFRIAIEPTVGESLNCPWKIWLCLKKR